ncbi:unnamed protein product [Caenorhabditis auriculariae]|uniref:START domain-containing protein 10 n=1 Tax=Caenorhabditis auriculariae TaxID=2777116 RepID=A0A8S1GXA3_9PELO|nr:unnamed protein product [Caenorhabditis auriculariae]
MRVNTARVWEDADYEKVRKFCNSDEGWVQVYKKKSIEVYTQIVANSSFQMIKACAHFPDVPSSIAYDVLHDCSYRAKWDKHMGSQNTIGLLNPNNDIGYYALNGLATIRGRDFVMQRSWLDTGEEKLICSHSVCHEDYPPQKGYVRGTVILSGYLIRNVGEGCEIIYVSHTDPKGKLPTWLANRVTKTIAPKVIKKLHKACMNYSDWKKNNHPHYKPWNFPDQQVDMPRVDLAKCQPKEYHQEIIDESNVSATSLKEDDDD